MQHGKLGMVGHPLAVSPRPALPLPPEPLSGLAPKLPRELPREGARCSWGGGVAVSKAGDLG